MDSAEASVVTGTGAGEDAEAEAEEALLAVSGTDFWPAARPRSHPGVAPRSTKRGTAFD
jgi:hypothetical protein